MPCNVKCLGGSFLEFFWSHMLLTLQVTLSNKLIMANKIALLSKKVTSVKKSIALVHKHPLTTYNKTEG
jgi:hypothetical protein